MDEMSPTQVGGLWSSRLLSWSPLLVTSAPFLSPLPPHTPWASRKSIIDQQTGLPTAPKASPAKAQMSVCLQVLIFVEEMMTPI